MSSFRNQNACLVSYAAVREACAEPYEMSLTGSDRDTVMAAVNRGIDSHLEACFCPERGDSYVHEGHRLNCVVSAESLPVLLRRLFETGDDESWLLAGDIMATLGFDDMGKFVGVDE